MYPGRELSSDASHQGKKNRQLIFEQHGDPGRLCWGEEPELGSDTSFYSGQWLNQCLIPAMYVPEIRAGKPEPSPTKAHMRW